jgi:peptidoglycan hydrolase-like protein with peptidoglycan-binding domain
MSSFHDSTYWAGNWHRFIGGGDNLILEFTGPNLIESEVLYLLCDLDNKCSVKKLSLDGEQKGEINLSEFSSKYNSLTLMPFISGRSSSFGGLQKSFSFSWQVAVENDRAEEKEAELILQLLAKIEELKRQIAYYQAKLGLATETGSSCQSLTADLYLGVNNFSQVSCLQEFLKSQGTDIYPEGFVTGQFFSLTEQAVIRFQEKYSSEILSPFGLEKGTGYVGSATREKINQLLGL